jgi:hypothetical protein
MQTLLDILNRAGGWNPGLYLKIENAPYMALVIEATDESGPSGLPAIGVQELISCAREILGRWGSIDLTPQRRKLTARSSRHYTKALKILNSPAPDIYPASPALPSSVGADPQSHHAESPEAHASYPPPEFPAS